MALKAGDRIRIKSKEQIRNDLTFVREDLFESQCGLQFKHDMWKFCGEELIIDTPAKDMADEPALKQACKGLYLTKHPVMFLATYMFTEVQKDFVSIWA